jgi:alkylated DNA repair dioxygenase AlkB
MNSLFSDEPVLPDGFVYYPNFITTGEETDICNAIMKIDLHPLIFQGYEAKRKVASFGYDWNFQTRVLTKGKEIPKQFEFLIKKVSEKISSPNIQFAELLLTEYPIGSVINWHRDAPPFDIIAGISLLSDCTFRFRPYDKVKQSRKAIISFPLQRRSLYIMSGRSRTDWEHSIPAVKEVRYSITLRTLK